MSRKRLKSSINKKVKFGGCDPANVVMAAAAIALPTLGITFGLLIVLIILGVILVVLW